MNATIRQKLGALAHVQEAARGGLIDEIMADITALAGAHAPGDLINWVAERWHAEVANRPLVNVHRRSLDGTWRQMLRHLGVDDRARLGPTHDELLEHREGEPDDLPLETGEGDAR